jgi:hypothetical protein
LRAQIVDALNDRGNLGTNTVGHKTTPCSLARNGRE